MVGHKYRRVDNIQRSGILNSSSLERQKGIALCEIKGRRSGRINKYETCSALEINAAGPSSFTGSRRKAGLCTFKGTPDDWTEEHLREPRKNEKRKSLDELQAREEAPFLSWTKKARRRSRMGARNTYTAVEMEIMPKPFDLNITPQEEMEKSLNSSEVLKLDTVSDEGTRRSQRNEQVCSEESSGSRLKVESTDKLSHSTGNCREQPIEDNVGPSREEVDKPQLLDFTSAHCSSLAADNTQDAILDTALQPPSEFFNGVSTLNTDHDLTVFSQNHLDSLNPVCSSESIKASVLDSKERETCLILKEKGGPETCGTLDFPHEKEQFAPCTNEGEVKLNLAEGRRCGLCGGDSRGEPPGSLLPVSSKHGDGQNSGCDSTYPGYSEWDAFGNESGWLGPLLGPLNDRFGIAGVWVHQECAIWSPEVYFAGVGRIKNIRAALRRGRLLKCTRCTRPGATIGCQIERCPRTYHLPCARFEGCFFDHKKFLMACNEHLHLFLPRLPGHRHRRNSLNLGRIRFKRKVGEWKKTAQRAAHLDIEAEEKWQEKAGVDEEFLRRERKRLQRDLARIAPVIVGGADGKYTSEGWESIAGSENVVQCMKEMVILPLIYPEAFRRLGVSPPRGVLLHGHPGTGKTLAVKALVGACAKGHKRIAYFARKGADCLGKYAGDAERQLRLLFYLAEKQQPSIIFFDEIDGLAPTRSQHQDQTQKSVVSTLLALMDGIKSRGSVVVIGATNRPDALDPALRRPGRFDREIYFPLPSIMDRTAIITLLTKSWKVPPKVDVISLLASQTTGFAGADLQALCAQAAMNSLRRTISVEDLMALVEKQGINEVPPFPDLTVNLVDWATALEKVSPPCSCRSAKAAVNIVSSAPLPHHMVRVLLWPMVEVIISLHLDDRVMLPPMLERVATLLEATLKSDLGGSWITHINSFLHGTTSSSSKQTLEQDLENVFSMAGMVSRQETTQDMPKVVYKGSKFRVMISGKQRTGLDHLAAWFLYGFEGFLEMCNLNLTTMLQEGGGDAVQGLIQILRNVQSKCPCVIYMPQMETWAVEPSAGNCVEEQKYTSQYWNVFLQQVNLISTSLQIAFVASSEMRKDEIPPEIVDFFVGIPISPSIGTGGCDDSIGNLYTTQEMWLSSCRSVPCSWVEVPLAPDMKVIFSRAADDYSELLSARLLSRSNCVDRACTAEFPRSCKLVTSVDRQQFIHKISLPSGCIENGRDGHDHEEVCKDANAKGPVVLNANVNEINSDDGLQEHLNSFNSGEKGTRSAFAPESKPAELHFSEQNHTSVAISMIGYQLLYHPELRELRYATSKLKEGPSFVTKTYGRRSSSRFTDDSNSQSDQGDSLDLKGLVAVGLLAYNGTYIKARDVARAVREVLELLMIQIDMKVNFGKDPEQFSHLLHQAASLEDKIFTWAHNLRRSEMVARVPERSIKEVFPSKLEAGEDRLVPAVETVTGHEKESKVMYNMQDPLSSNAVTFLDLSGGDVNTLTFYAHDHKKSGSPVLHEISCGSQELQCNATKNEESEERKFQLRDTTGDKLNEVELESCSVANAAAWKCCPDCLHLAKHALQNLFIRSWRRRGSDISLNVAEEVIGSCSSAVSVALNRILNRGLENGNVQCATLSHESGCKCRAKHKQRTIASIFEIYSSNGRSDKGKPMTSAQLSDSDKKNLFTLGLVCLCPLVKVISDLK